MSDRRVRRWDVPVIRALDAIERLPGFSPDHVEWDHFRFYGHGFSGAMETVAIYAYTAAPDTSGFARFAVTGTRFTVTDRDRRDLTGSGLARELDVPASSAIRATAELRDALNRSLREYNTAHAPPQATHPAHRVPEAFNPSLGTAPTGTSRRLDL